MSNKRKPQYMRLDVETVDKFKSKCKENGISMNAVIEALMLAYIDDAFQLKPIVSYQLEFTKNNTSMLLDRDLTDDEDEEEEE